jgi:hypothetical protein
MFIPGVFFLILLGTQQRLPPKETCAEILGFYNDLLFGRLHIRLPNQVADQPELHNTENNLPNEINQQHNEPSQESPIIFKSSSPIEW